jgi:hypothetical protein
MPLRSTALAAAFILALPAVAQAGQTWTTAFGQGTLQANVTGAGGSELYAACAAGQVPPLAVLFFETAAPLAGEVGQAYLVEFLVDDKPMTLVMALSQPTILEYPAGEKITFRALESLTRLLREGKAVTVASTQLKWSDSYSLKGSGKALDGLFEGCEPAD